jgi:alpha-tubulin suppressor-like RCC1 family protein
VAKPLRHASSARPTSKRAIFALGSALLAGLSASGFVAVGGAEPSSATTQTPVISSFTPSRASIVTTNGWDTLTAVVQNAVNCTFSSVPNIAGLPITKGCSTGSAKVKVIVPLNTTTAVQTYTFSLAVTGAPMVSATVTVSPGDGGPPQVVGNGGYSECVLLASSRVDCWGDGAYGQLGNGSTTSSDIPVAVVGLGGTGALSGVKSVVSSSQGSYCAVLISGRVDCWGSNYHGQLGSGTTPIAQSAVPLPVIGTDGTSKLSGVQGVVGQPVESGSYCALLSSGGVDCWGEGGRGQLGNGTINGSDFAVAVLGVGGTQPPLSAVTSIVGTSGSYCAVLASQELDCWGYGAAGELGDGSNSSSDFPMAVVGVQGSGTLSGVNSLTGGNYSYCAVLTSTGVDCWGQYFLGNNTIGNSDVPVAVLGIGATMPPLSGVASMSAGGNLQSHCAVLTNTHADCWGRYPGDGTASAYAPVAVLGVGQTTPLSGVASIVGHSLYNTCAMLTSGRVDCWGVWNSYGDLGNGSWSGTTQATTPQTVLGVGGTGALSSVVSMEATSDTLCAVLKTGGVDCWGSNQYEQLGDQAATGPQACFEGISCSTTPVIVKGLPGGTSKLSLS